MDVNHLLQGTVAKRIKQLSTSVFGQSLCNVRLSGGCLGLIDKTLSDSQYITKQLTLLLF